MTDSYHSIEHRAMVLAKKLGAQDPTRLRIQEILSDPPHLNPGTEKASKDVGFLTELIRDAQGTLQHSL